MNKPTLLRMMRLLSGLESAMMCKAPYPAYLLEEIGEVVTMLEQEVLKEDVMQTLQPLTDAQIDYESAKARNELMDYIDDYGTLEGGQQKFIRKIARAVEQAHGIKGDLA